MQDKELARLQRLLSEATPVPWDVQRHYLCHRMFPVASFYGDSACVSNSKISDQAVEDRLQADMELVRLLRLHAEELLDAYRQVHGQPVQG